MPKEEATEQIEVAYVRTQIPDLCRQNAQYIKSRTGQTVEEIYRYILTAFLYGEPERALEMYDTLLGRSESGDEP